MVTGSTELHRFTDDSPSFSHIVTHAAACTYARTTPIIVILAPSFRRLFESPGKHQDPDSRSLLFLRSDRVIKWNANVDDKKANDNEL